MAINKNHEFEELNGIKCAIVEKNVLQERIDFLKPLLEGNGYTVVVIPSPLPKTAATTTDATPDEVAATFTIGVTNLMFNPTNAIFGRLLRTKDGHIVTLSYWQQKEMVSNDGLPYYEN
ncbi:MAG: hypothetical protein JSR09_05130 [Bacteroidetes bacterium]|nr:hypothetical protein [Bacteroidota bacterium]MBS1649069.1 hypothetical protein [Bacteroidota bacterium]